MKIKHLFGLAVIAAMTASCAAINHVGKPYFMDCSKHSFNNPCFSVNKSLFYIPYYIHVPYYIYITFSESRV